MIRLIYLSSSTIPEHDLKVELVKILEASNINNAHSNITGVLVHGGGYFVQVLEGPDKEVMQKYLDIVSDKRHVDQKLLLISIAEERAFPEWAMATFTADKLAFEDVSALAHHASETVDAKMFSVIVKDFIKRLTKNVTSNTDGVQSL